MDRMRWEHVAAAALLLVLAAMVASRLGSGAVPPQAPAVPVRITGDATAGTGGPRLVVHVAGAVRRPGVYRLRAGLRVDDAVRRAGGPTPRGDLSALNLAAELEDGRQVLVPRRVRAAGGTAAPAADAVAGSAAPGAPGPINLNTATVEQLDTLEGIGPTTAQKIVDWRTENGGFGSVEELGRIPGIGEKRMATLRARLTV